MTNTVFKPSEGVGVAIKPEPTKSAMGKIMFDPTRTVKETAKIITHEAAGSGLVPRWSASTLKTYETCPYQVFLDKVKHEPQDEHPAAARGTALHDIAECYVQDTWDSIDDKSKPHLPDWEQKIFPKWKDQLDELRTEYENAKVEVEGEWAFDKDWTPTAWDAPDAWARMKLDVLHWQDETSVKVIDYKSGKKFGNEAAHSNQGLIYAIGTFMRHDLVQFVETNFWYLDHNTDNPQRYTREQAMLFLPNLTNKATLLTSDTEFKPKPSGNNCRFCAYKKQEICEWRI
jgi:hypothetical protein